MSSTDTADRAAGRMRVDTDQVGGRLALGRDFAQASTGAYGIEVLHPDSFLVRLLAKRPDDVTATLERGVAGLRKPPQTMHEFLASLTPTVPMFALLVTNAAANRLGGP